VKWCRSWLKEVCLLRSWWMVTAYVTNVRYCSRVLDCSKSWCGAVLKFLNKTGPVCWQSSCTESWDRHSWLILVLVLLLLLFVRLLYSVFAVVVRTLLTAASSNQTQLSTTRTQMDLSKYLPLKSKLPLQVAW